MNIYIITIYTLYYYSYTHRYHIYPTYAVHIVLYGEREGVVEHILHIGNVQATGCHICAYEGGMEGVEER